MNKKRNLFAPLLAALLFLASAGCTAGNVAVHSQLEQPQAMVQQYEQSKKPLYNPLMGFAAEADYKEAVGENTLVYVEVLWAQVEPQQGVYDFTALEEQNHLAQWRKEGKHAVLRFICDKPSDTPHMDIPQWLYDQTADGTHYAYDDAHKGYSPDYANPVFIEAHAKMIAALGAHFGQDTFVSFVELGSLGHWGEWHVNYETGIVPMPKEDVREQYVTPYFSAFSNAKILMRRPFHTAAKNGFGLYDDTAGNPEATALWLDWIQNGGDYAQAGEKDALTPMPDAWKAAPIGGEFNSDLSMREMLTGGLDTTISLLGQFHTTFLGPKFPSGRGEENGEGCEDGIEAVRKTLGYRLWVSRAEYFAPEDGGQCSIALTWNNRGSAPMYWDWDVYLYFYDAGQKLTGKIPVNINLTELLPKEEIQSVTKLEAGLDKDAACVCVGIEDPMTGKPAVSLAMDTKEIDKTTVLFEIPAE